MLHPVLRHMKPKSCATPAQEVDSATSTEKHDVIPSSEEGQGLARLGVKPENHPRVQIKKDCSQAFVPKINVLRDGNGQEPEQMRDLRYNAGRDIELERSRQIKDTDFETFDTCGISNARAQLEAANLKTAYEQTVTEEVNFQKSFNNHVRILVSREEVVIGLMHLWDFAESYVSNPHSRTLTAQLFLIVQHIRDDGLFKESFVSIVEPEGRWLLDLLNVLQSIVVQERSLPLSEKVAAVNYAVVSLGKHYAKKIFKTPFVPIDKELKISTFYMRAILKLLMLSNDLGIYRNEKIQKLASTSRRREMTDSELFYNLRRALTSKDDDEFHTGGDISWKPSHVDELKSGHGMTERDYDAFEADMPLDY